MKLKYLTIEKINHIKNLIREMSEKNERPEVIELANDSNENIEAYSVLKADEEFKDIEFRLVKKSLSTSTARVNRFMTETLMKK